MGLSDTRELLEEYQVMIKTSDSTKLLDKKNTNNGNVCGRLGRVSKNKSA